jgi:hypothetical protein
MCLLHQHKIRYQNNLCYLQFVNQSNFAVAAFSLIALPETGTGNKGALRLAERFGRRLEGHCFLGLT